MFFFGSFFAFLTLFHRILVYSFDLIPADKSLDFTFLCGFLSDFSLIFLFISFFWLLSFFCNRKFNAFALFLSFFCLLFYTVHLKYVEFFGMQLRGFHLFSVTSVPISSSFLMLFDSWLPVFFFIFSSFIGFFLWFKTHQISFKRKTYWGFLFIFCYLIFNISWIQARKHVTRNVEGEKSPIISLYFEMCDYKSGKEIKNFPSLTELKKLRTLLDNERVYLSEQYPLLQRELPPIKTSENDKEFFLKFQKFIRDEEKLNGPWNVILILSESLRAFEFESFGLNDV